MGEYNLFEQIGRQSKDIYFTYDVVNGKLSYVSPAFEVIYGTLPEEIWRDCGSIINIVHPEDIIHVQDHFLESIENRALKIFEFRIRCADKSEKHIKASIYPITNNDNLSAIAGIAENITTVKTNILYGEKINARKDTMLDILAHDLRGPIGVISMMASHIEKEPQVAGNENILKSVKYIQQLCKHNIDLIRDLMNQEFLESTEVDLRKERADLVAEITDVINFYKRSSDILSKTFIITCQQDKLYVQVDSLKFLQVINNLISNAIKFTAENGVITVDIQDQDHMVQITVSDNGIGIPTDLQPYLFDKFTKARRKGLSGENPVGLGMSIAKAIVELHGGTIHVESKENTGTTFVMHIPKQ